MKKGRLLLQVGISVACLAAVFMMVRPGALWDACARASFPALVGVVLLMPPAVFTRAWRWRFILGRKNVDVPIITMYRVTFIGMALNLFLPAGLGDVARSYYGWQAQGNKEADKADKELRC